MKISVSYKSEVGNFRKNNQDAVLFIENKAGNILAVVCDGLGGHSCGEVASDMTVKMLKSFFETTNFSKLKTDGQVYAWLGDKINLIQTAMFEYSSKNPAASDMGTTLVLLLIANNKTYFVNIGDSRIYHFAQNDLQQLTVDHNILNSYLQKNHSQPMKEFDLNQTYWKVLTSALGPTKPLKTDIFHLPITTPAFFLLTSDGVHDFLDQSEIIDILQKKGSLKMKVKLLIKKAYDNVSTDNVTVLLLLLE